MEGQAGDRYLDTDEDPISTYDEYDEDWDDDTAAEPGETDDPVAETLIVELGERLNAWDLEAVAELLHPEAESSFLQATDRDEVVAGLADLGERNPTLTFTRGELGMEPVLAVWVMDTTAGDHDLMGLLRFDCDTEGEEPTITRLDLFEPGPDDDVLLEEPDPAEIAEWEDWDTIDEG